MLETHIYLEVGASLSRWNLQFLSQFVYFHFDYFLKVVGTRTVNVTHMTHYSYWSSYTLFAMQHVCLACGEELLDITLGCKVLQHQSGFLYFLHKYNQSDMEKTANYATWKYLRIAEEFAKYTDHISISSSK